MDVTVGLWRRLSAEELMLLNCGVGEDSWESLGLQGDPTSPFWRRSTLGFLGRNDDKAEAPILWPPDMKSWLIGKDSDAGRDWAQEEKGTTEDEMAGWHHRLDGRESAWPPGVGDGQGGLACCDSWGHRVGHDWVTELNWNPSGFRFTWGPVESPWFNFSTSSLRMEDKIFVFYSFFKKFLCSLLISTPAIPLWFLSASENFLGYEVQNSQIFVSSVHRFSCSLIFHLTSRIRKLSFRPLFTLFLFVSVPWVPSYFLPELASPEFCWFCFIKLLGISTSPAAPNIRQ